MKSALVFGAGISGKAAATLLLRKGYRVAVTCKSASSETDELASSGVEILLGAPVVSARKFFERGLVDVVAITSPGIPMNAPELALCAELGVRQIGELELGFGFLKSRMIAVTGSKGKSSLVKLIADTLSGAGVTAVPCGNYGTAVCEVAVLERPPAVAVVECSSFQLEGLGTVFKPASAMILNLSHDHLDRHLTLEGYREAKLNLFQNMDEEALQLLPAPSEDPYRLNAGYEARYGRAAVTFGCGADAQWHYQSGCVTDRESGCSIAITGSYFDNSILGPAAAAACALLRAEGLSEAAIETGFCNFLPLPHRMQRIGNVNGVTFIDDSKATSIAALLAGVQMAEPPVYLVAGGRLKEKILVTGKEVVTLGVQKVYLIGECMSEMESAWSPELPMELCGTLVEAVTSAFRDARGRGTILLSPGTASFDQFKDYQQRGDCFARISETIISKAAKSANQ